MKRALFVLTAFCVFGIAQANAAPCGSIFRQTGPASFNIGFAPDCNPHPRPAARQHFAPRRVFYPPQRAYRPAPYRGTTIVRGSSGYSASSFSQGTVTTAAPVPSPEQIAGMVPHHTTRQFVPCAPGYVQDPNTGICSRTIWVPGN